MFKNIKSNEINYKLISEGFHVEGRPLGYNDYVFCCIYCKDFNVVRNLKNCPPEHKDLHMPMVLMQTRYDNTIGFPGGTREPHHVTLLDTLVQELREEINFNVTPYIADLKPLATFFAPPTDSELYGAHIHTYALEVSESTFKAIHKCSLISEHMYYEIGGCIAISITPDFLPKAYEHNFAATSRLELEYLVKHLNLI